MSVECKLNLSENIMCLALSIQKCLRSLQELCETLTRVDRPLTEESSRMCGAKIKAATAIAMKSQSDVHFAERQESLEWATAVYMEFARRHGKMVTKKQGDGREDRATVKNGKRISKSIAERIQPEVEYSASKDLLAIIKDLVFALCNERIREPFLAESIISSLTNPPASCFGCLIDCLLMTGKHALADAIVTELLSKHLPREAKKSSNSLPKRRKSNAMSTSIP